MKKDIMFKKSVSWIATGEQAFLLCAYAPTPGKALKKIGKLIDSLLAESDDVVVQGINLTYDDEDDIVHVNATITVMS